MNSSDVPAAIKDVAPYVQRAKEVERVDSVVAYWCTSDGLPALTLQVCIMRPK